MFCFALLSTDLLYFVLIFRFVSFRSVFAFGFVVFWFGLVWPGLVCFGVVFVLTLDILKTENRYNIARTEAYITGAGVVASLHYICSSRHAIVLGFDSYSRPR